MTLKLIAGAATLALSTAALAGAGQAAVPTFYGPSTYVSQADAPFHAADFDHFYLEDVEDNAVNTLGLSVTGPGFCISNNPGCFPGAIIDSVGNGGDQTLGHSMFGVGFMDVTFDPLALGGLPTYAGLVWTDGNNPVTFEAFDENGLSLGTLIGNHADGTFAGTLADDRFYGLTYDGGISRLRISNPPATEIDHIQYALNDAGTGVPEPASWALMILGFGAAGALLRSNRRNFGHAAV